HRGRLERLREPGPGQPRPRAPRPHRRRPRGPMSVEIVDPRIMEYLRRLYDDGDPVRTEMEALAEKRRFPIVGPLVGRHLELLTRAIGAQRVFELGSGYGYSALHFAR